MIERVDLRVSPIVLELTPRKIRKRGSRQVQRVSCGGRGIALRMAGEAQFSDACVLDPSVVALRRKVKIEADTSIGRVQSHVFIRLKDGRTLERRVEHALGTLERPMSDADLETKFRALVDGI